MSEHILDVGCGSTKIPGAVGIDHLPLPNVDIIHNLDELPWPFKDEQFDRIVFSHSISHLSNLPAVMTECHRLLKNNGFVEIVAPHYASDNFNTDPTHRTHMGIRSMNYFVDNVDFGYRYIDAKKCFKLIKSSISFREEATSWRLATKSNPFRWTGIEWLVNKRPRLYERFLCWLLPASEVYFLLQKKPALTIASQHKDPQQG